MSMASSRAATSIYAPGGSNNFGVGKWPLIIGLALAAWLVWKLFAKHK